MATGNSIAVTLVEEASYVSLCNAALTGVFLLGDGT